MKKNTLKLAEFKEIAYLCLAEKIKGSIFHPLQLLA